jgi:hypothetical protein
LDALVNGEEFYEHFKNALRAVGLDWSSKDQAKIRAEKGYLIVEYADLQMHIRLPRKK